MKKRQALITLLALSIPTLFLGCNKPQPYITTGYVESVLFYVSSPLGGYLQDLTVHEGQMVKKGKEIATFKGQSLTAPAYSQIVDVYYQKDEYVPPTLPIMSLFIPSRMKIVFYVPEKNLNKISLGKTITIKIDDTKFETNISYISKQAEYTPDIIFNETNKYKLVYKVKADVPAQKVKLLKIGQPVDVNYE